MNDNGTQSGQGRDDLDPAKGILFGLCLSLMLIVGIVALVWSVMAAIR